MDVDEALKTSANEILKFKSGVTFSEEEEMKGILLG
jgi:hypothetical protein